MVEIKKRFYSYERLIIFKTKKKKNHLVIFKTKILKVQTLHVKISVVNNLLKRNYDSIYFSNKLKSSWIQTNINIGHCVTIFKSMLTFICLDYLINFVNDTMFYSTNSFNPVIKRCGGNFSFRSSKLENAVNAFYTDWIKVIEQFRLNVMTSHFKHLKQ